MRENRGRMTKRKGFKPLTDKEIMAAVLDTR